MIIARYNNNKKKKIWFAFTIYMASKFIIFLWFDVLQHAFRIYSCCWAGKYLLSASQTMCSSYWLRENIFDVIKPQIYFRYFYGAASAVASVSKPGTVRSISARLHIFRRDSRHSRAVVSYWWIHVHLLNAWSTGYIKGFINDSSIILTCIDKYCFIQNSARYIYFFFNQCNQCQGSN